MLLGNLIFDVPFRGSFSIIARGSFLSLFSTLGVGILIATVSSSQQQAMLGTFGFMLPAMLLSGFMSPISSMPPWLRPLTMLIPMRHYIEIMRGWLRAKMRQAACFSWRNRIEHCGMSKGSNSG